MNYGNRLAALAILLAPAALFAQPPADWEPRAGDDRRGERAERGQMRRLEHLTDYLELSDAQQVELEALFDTQREARRADAEALRGEREALRDLLNGEDPNPTLVGQHVLTIHAARQAMRGRGKAHLVQVRGILTPAQAEKFDALVAAREMGRERGGGRHGRGGQRFGAPDGQPQPTDG